MPATQNWIYLGNTSQTLDPLEISTTSQTAEGYSSFQGLNFGGSGNPLYQNIVSATLAKAAGATTDAASLSAHQGGFTGSNDTITTTINGVPRVLIFDNVVYYNTRLTYADGSTVEVTLQFAQTTTNELFLVPPTAGTPNSTSVVAALQNKPIQSLAILTTTPSTLTGYNGANLTIDRMLVGFDNGIVNGTAGNDLIDSTYVENLTNGTDRIDNGDGTSATGTSWQDDVVLAGAGNDTVHSGLGNDSVSGGVGNDSLDGRVGNDTLRGEEGNDILIGGLGNDLLDGGLGNDTFTFTEAGFGTDTVIGGEDTLGTDRDVIDASGLETGTVNVIYTGGEAGTLTSSTGGSVGFTQIEEIRTGTGNDTINAALNTANSTYNTGEGADSVLGGSGNETIVLGAGNDFVSGGAGNDLLDGGTGNDTFSFSGANFGNDTIIGGEDSSETDRDLIDTTGLATGAVNIVYSGAEAGMMTSTSGGTAAFSQIEELHTGAGNDSINAALNTTDSLYNTGAGADTVQGGSGNETVILGAGNDTADGGAGNDTIFGGSGENSIRGGAGNDVIYGAQDAVNGPDGSEGSRLYGDAGDDFIYGGNGADYIDGGDDNYMLQGLDGNDTILGGAGDDMIYGDGGNDTIDGGIGDDHLSGGGRNDLVLGGDGNDTLSGGAGDDTLRGGDGDDHIFGNEGADYLVGEGGNDTLDGGADDDTLWGGDQADLLIGGEGDDWLTGDAGDDTLQGDEGDDFLDSGDDNDSIDGGTGNDTLHGGTGRDTLDGGDGNDFVHGGIWGGGVYTDDNEVDYLTGGDGFDTFVAGNGDIITDFNTTTGGNIDDSIRGNNDFVDLSQYYSDAKLAIINGVREQAGLTPYVHPLQWLRADQQDGVLDDITTGNGFGSNFTLTIQNGGAAISGDDLTADNTAVVCFGSDVMIETARGPVAAGALAVGQLVRTRDGGLQPIRWIGRRHLGAAELGANPNLRPIVIRKGALGAGLPQADLVVSPQHRILLRSKIAQRMFGTDEVLAAAKQLLQIDGIDIAPQAEVTYVHFLFDDHQIVTANGAEAESLHTGEQALNAVGHAAREEILSLFPELRSGPERPMARPALSGRMARKLAVRHRQKGFDLYR